MLKAITACINNHAAGYIGHAFDAYLAAKTPEDEVFAKVKLYDGLYALSQGHDYCGNGSTGVARTEAARVAIENWV